MVFPTVVAQHHDVTTGASLRGLAKLYRLIPWVRWCTWLHLQEACPKGIDVYFDNVGGEILDIALGQLRYAGPLCCTVKAGALDSL